MSTIHHLEASRGLYKRYLRRGAGEINNYPVPILDSMEYNI